jgi:hypothetical protein
MNRSNTREMDPLLRTAAQQNEVSDVNPSPPYRAYPSRSNLVLGALQSPVYHSRVDLMADNRDEKPEDGGNYPVGVRRPGDDDDLRDAQPKPTVHYPTDVHEVPVLRYRNGPPKVDPRPTSMVTTDDEHEDENDGENYDWSAEDDLEDQEAEYEKQMGVKTKPEGWGIKRYLYIIGLPKYFVK